MPVDNSQYLEEREEAKFNMALACLKRVDTILFDIGEISTTVDNPVMANNIKYKKIRELFTTSYPLIKNKDKKKELRQNVECLKFLFGAINNVKLNRKIPTCRINADEILDYTIQKIQDILQEEGYFMPSKEDEGMF